MARSDYNPLHADADMAASVGFERPILHGLCTMGFAMRAVIDSFCESAAEVRWFKVRFAKPVYPGETLETRMWRQGEIVVLQTIVAERGVVVISNAAAGLKGASSFDSYVGSSAAATVVASSSSAIAGAAAPSAAEPMSKL